MLDRYFSQGELVNWSAEFHASDYRFFPAQPFVICRAIFQISSIHFVYIRQKLVPSIRYAKYG